jgi:hypothetical protein
VLYDAEEAKIEFEANVLLMMTTAVDVTIDPAKVGDAFIFEKMIAPT